MSGTNGSKWVNASAGPRQVKDLQRAISALLSEGRTQDELYGVAGGAEHRSSVMAMMGPVRAEVTALDEAIRAKFACEVTRQNVRAIIAEYEQAMPEARKSRPTVDNRRSPEEEAERVAAAAKREAVQQAKRDAESAVMAQVLAKAPHGAKALIYAEYHVDASDPMTDYFNSHVTRTVAIGWRFSSREDFRALRAAAGQFTETAHIAADPDCEHRENYSMGSGNYLSDHGSARSGTGWVIRSRDLPCPYVQLTQDAIPQAPAAPAVPVADSEGVTVTPSSLGRDGVVEIRFSSKPAPEVLADLKAHGFRWARGNQCWYGRDTAYAEALAGTGSGGDPAPEAAPAPAPVAPVRKVRTTAVSADVEAILRSAETDGPRLVISARLDRAQYVAVNKILEAAGFRWSRRDRAHLCDGDAGGLLAGLLEAGEVTRPEDLGWFPTPAAVVAQVVEAGDLAAGLEVLEPSAGTGAIASEAAAAGCVVDCVEIDAGRAGKIAAAGYARSVTMADFLATRPRAEYDRVLMNPPFAGKADIAHVAHALGFLRPGGLLVAVMAAGVSFRTDRQTAAFREGVEAAGGEILPLPEQAFRESGTDVRTVLAVIPAGAVVGASAELASA